MDLKSKILVGLTKGMKLIPTNNKKQPIVRSWKNGVSVIEVGALNKVDGIAIATGDNLECIDFDLKYDLTGKLYDNYVSEVKMYSEELYNSMVIQTTVNKGYHWFYKCEGLTDGNTKLARREANDEEKEKGDKVKVLLETRGCNGYVMIQPTKGYCFTQGRVSEANTISKVDRDFLMSLAKSYDTYRTKTTESTLKPSVIEKTAFDDYNERFSSEDTIDLLISHGWREVGRQSDKVLMLRAGSTDSKHSGHYNLSEERFSVFSTSTDFEPETRHNKAAVFCVLECGGDFKLAAKKLYELGYGTKTELDHSKKEVVQEEVNEDDLSKYTVPYSDIWDIVDNWYDGKIEIGLKTGMPKVDNFFRYRKNSLYTITAGTNIGKTTVTQFLQVLGSKLHGLKWLIFAAENSEDDYAETLLSFYLQANPKIVKEQDRKRHDEGRLFIEKHFIFLKDVRSVDRALMVAKAFSLKHDIYALFIDPINSVAPRDNQDNWDYSEAVTASRNIVNFRKEYCAVWISQHPRIGKQRDKGMPSTTDGEFGVFANKADVSLVFDRDKGALDANKTEMKIDKVRSKKLGCNTTPDNQYIELYYQQYWFDMSAPVFEKNGTVTREYYRNPLGSDLKADSENSVFDDFEKDVPLPTVNPASAFGDIIEEVSQDEVPF